MIVIIGPTSAPELRRILKDSRWFVVRNAVHLLHEVAPREYVDAIASLITHSDRRVVSEAVAYLLDADDRRGLVGLRSLLSSDSEEGLQEGLSVASRRRRQDVAAVLAAQLGSFLEEPRSHYLPEIAKMMASSPCEEATTALIELASLTGRRHRHRLAPAFSAMLNGLASRRDPGAQQILEALAQQKDQSGRAGSHHAQELEDVMNENGSHGDQAVQLLTVMAVGLTTRRLYSAEHPRAQAARNRLLELLRELSANDGELTFVRLDDELFVDSVPLSQAGDQIGSVIRELARCSVERVTFCAGLRDDELDRLLETLADRSSDSLEGSEHILVETVSRSASFFEGVRDASSLVPAVALRDRVRVLHDALTARRSGEPLAVAALSEVVASLDEEVGSSPSPLVLMAALEGPELWTAVHAHNVTLLALAFAHLLGLSELERSEVGLAATLHDLGKVLGDPNEITRELQHTGPELELDRDHPRRGYEALIAEPTVPPIVPIVAMEHHVGRIRGGFPKLVRRHRIHPVSSMVATAEAFDILHTVRAPSGLMSREAIVAVLQELAQTQIDPLFVHLTERLMALEAGDPPDA